MGMTVELESPIGTPVFIREFLPGQSLRITGHARSSLNIPFFQGGNSVQVQITGRGFTPIYAEDATSITGRFAVDVILPLVSTEANIRVAVTFGVAGQDVTNIPIGIGRLPADPDKPIAPPPSSDPIKDWLSEFKWPLIAIAAGLVALLVLWMVLNSRR